MSGNWYERNILPWLIDFACGMKSVSKQRMKVIPQAHGRVLEIGIGTGLNLPFYDTSQVRELVGVEPSQRMHHLVLQRSRAARLPVEIVGITAERLPLADAVFDTVVSTYTLCTIPDPVAALREARRVLAPGGRLLLVAPLEWEVHQAPHDYYRYTVHALRYLFQQAGLEVVTIEPVGGYFRLMARRILNGLQFFPGPFFILAALVAAPVAFVLPLLDGLDKRRDFTLGYICEARRRL